MSGKRLLALVVITVLLASLAACGQHSSRVLSNIINPQTQSQQQYQQDDSANSGPLPGVFELDGRIVVNRTVSADQTVASQGWEALRDGQTGTNGTSDFNVEQEGTFLTLRALAPGEYAYGIYGQAVGIDPKPLKTLIDSTICKIGGGRDEDIPISYFVGIADYTSGAWRWFGPFGDVDVMVTVNSETLKSRFKSPSDNYYFAVLASNGSKATSALPADGSTTFPIDVSARHTSDDEEDPGGLTIEEICTWVEENLLTEPAIVTGLQATADAGGVHLSWDTNIDPDVDIYQVLRDDMDDADEPILLQGVLAPTVTYTDTTGIPGKSYRYLVRARNDAGYGGPSEVIINFPNQAPVADIQADFVEGYSPLTVTFDASMSYDLDGSIVKFEWDWEGDGIFDDDSGTTSVRQHIYSARGIHNCIVRVTDDLGAADEASIIIDVYHWESLIVDDTYNVGLYNSLTIVNGYPAICYFDRTTYDLKYVRATSADGSVWGTPIPIASGGSLGMKTKLTIVNGNPAVTYSDWDTNELKFVRATDADGSVWNTPIVVASSYASVSSCLAIVNGYPAICFDDSPTESLYYVRASDADGSAWGTPQLLDVTGDGVFETLLETVNGNPAIAYIDATGEDLKFVAAMDADGTAWNMPLTVDSSGEVGLTISFAVVDGKPAIAYIDGMSIPNDLKYVRASDAIGSVWDVPVTLVDGGEVTCDISLSVVNGYPAITYCDDDLLKYVQATDVSGSAWDEPQNVNYEAGGDASLAVVNGNPAVAYYDPLNAILKYAYYLP